MNSVSRTGTGLKVGFNAPTRSGGALPVGVNSVRGEPFAFARFWAPFEARFGTQRKQGKQRKQGERVKR